MPQFSCLPEPKYEGTPGPEEIEEEGCYQGVGHSWGVTAGIPHIPPCQLPTWLHLAAGVFFPCRCWRARSKLMALPARMPAEVGEGGPKHLGFVSHILGHGRWNWAILGSRAAWQLGGPLRKAGTHPAQKISEDFNCGHCHPKRKGCSSSSQKDGVPVISQKNPMAGRQVHPWPLGGCLCAYVFGL